MIRKMNSNPLRPIVLGKHFEIHISVLFLFGIAIALDFVKTLAVTYAIVLIHELAHFLTATRLGVEGDKLVIMPFGVTMQLKNSTVKNPEDELKIAVAGPVSNVIMAGLVILLNKSGYVAFDDACYLVMLNFGIAVVNVVPALPLDGGRMLKAYLTLQMGYIKAYNLTMTATKITAVLLILGGVALIFVTGFNFSFFMIGAFLIANMVSEQRGKRLILMREILYSRQKLMEVGSKNCGVITIMSEAPARKALKNLTYNKYYTINIVNDNMDIIGAVTETKLIQGLINKGIRIKAADLLTK